MPGGQATPMCPASVRSEYAATRLTFQLNPRDNITPALMRLNHWLPVSHRLHFNFILSCTALKLVDVQRICLALSSTSL
jgi:hypothetical protein